MTTSDFEKTHGFVSKHKTRIIVASVVSVAIIATVFEYVYVL